MPVLSPGVRARIEQQMLAAASAEPRLRPNSPDRGANPGRSWLFGAALGAVFLVIFLSIVAVGTASGAMPDSMLYPVKLALEDAQLQLAPADTAPELHLKFAGRRLGEAEALLSEDVFDAAVLEDLSEHMEAALQASADLQPVQGIALLRRWTSLADETIETLQPFADTMPASARNGLERALQASAARSARAKAVLNALLSLTGQPTDPVPPADPASPVDPGEPAITATVKITICHQPGTPAQKTLVVAEPALAGHLEHGDHLGECSVEPPEPPEPPAPDKVEICHAPGTPAEQTLLVSADAVEDHLAHGDYLGPCLGEESEDGKPTKPPKPDNAQPGGGAEPEPKPTKAPKP
jgi:hypothetical protein